MAAVNCTPPMLHWSQPCAR